MIERVLLGLLLAGLLSSGAYFARALSISGAIAAAFLGTIVLGAGGWTPAVLLVLFFLSSSAFTHLSRVIKPDFDGQFAKGGRRDARQVLANGALPAVFSILLFADPESIALIGIVGSLAAATADTWATEWGVLARRPPRRITDWTVVPAGSSGGITALGTLGSILGALLIGAAAALLERSPQYIIVAIFSGALGSAFDSVLGATVQAQHRCSSCGKLTEQHPIHKACGMETAYADGIAWIDNDVVNLLANAFGALVALLWITGSH